MSNSKRVALRLNLLRQLSKAVGRRKRKAEAELLLQAKADVESRDGSGQTPLSLAAAGGYWRVVELLLQVKANIDSKDNKGLTPLSWATANGHEAVVKLIQFSISSWRFSTTS